MERTEGWGLRAAIRALTDWFLAGIRWREWPARMVSKYQISEGNPCQPPPWKKRGGPVQTLVRRGKRFRNRKADAEVTRIQTPPFEAAWSTPCIMIVFRLRLNGKEQVDGFWGSVIRVFTGGRDSGWIPPQHGLAKSITFAAASAGSEAARPPPIREDSADGMHRSA